MGREKAGQRRQGMEVARGGRKGGQETEVLQEEADERLRPGSNSALWRSTCPAAPAGGVGGWRGGRSRAEET